MSAPSAPRQSTLLKINLGGWFSGGKDEEDSRDDIQEQEDIGKGKLGGTVASVMDSFESFKKSQRVGKVTSSLLSELGSTTVEGTAEDGKVRVIFDCQQRPLRVDIDEAYFDSADSAADVANAVTRALKLAHSKSIERMDEKLKGFYNELGLPSRS